MKLIDGPGGRYTVRQNEYELRRALRVCAYYAGLGYLYDASRRQLLLRLSRAKAYRKLSEADICDNEHPIIVADTYDEVVYLVQENELVDGCLPVGYATPRNTLSFEDFANGANFNKEEDDGVDD